MKKGIYELFGNCVEYEGGDEAYDVDSAEWIPADLLASMGTFLESFDSAQERMEQESCHEGWGW